MNRTMKEMERRFRRPASSTARNAWIAFGGLLALGALALTLRELPSMRREYKLMRM